MYLTAGKPTTTSSKTYIKDYLKIYKYLPAVPAHDLKDKAFLIAGCGGDDGVNSLDDTMEGGVRTDSHISTTEVVVDGAQDADDAEVRVHRALGLADLAWKMESVAVPQ